ncbi:MAG TPA: DEAD/DEAH box helicase [Bryobacteraceae bacterium]|jgi:ATP-dependent RNA helicase RhlE|nr:DEAD/DEAH box helicase [Bryobacteraceae bacterium]
MTLFSELQLSPILQTNLARNLLVKPTPVQSEAIPPALSGSDVVATAQTGTGKTLAFVLPILQSLMVTPVRGIGAVILSPTRELAIQINEAFNLMAAGTGIRSAIVVGGLNENAQLQQIRKGAQVVIATPGRLTDFLDRKLVNLGSVRIFVLDEADRMLDMGFLPAIQGIMAKVPSNRQTLCFSATIEKSVAHLIDANTRNPVRITIGGAVTKASEQVDLHVYEVEQTQKVALLHFMLQNEGGSFLVFARTKHGTDRLAKRLAHAGVKAVGIHGDRTQNQRNQALDGFRRGSYRVLVATDVAARGIHVDGIAHVVNFDLPQAPEDFVHRVGRTGRAGARGTASTFASHSERKQVRDIERALKTQLVRQLVPADLPEAPAGPEGNRRSYRMQGR